MFNILTLNKIAAVGTSRLGDNYAYGDDVQNPRKKCCYARYAV